MWEALMNKKVKEEEKSHSHKIKTSRGIQTFGHPHPIDAMHPNTKTQKHHDFTIIHDDVTGSKAA